MDDCLACRLTSGELPLPGGQIYRTAHWVVEHCVGPLGPGTLVVKPQRHVLHVADLTEEEATELGPLLRRSSIVASQLVDADQVYNCLWSHPGGRPVHVHYVIQPVTDDQVKRAGTVGPELQVAMFTAGDQPPETEIEQVAARARLLFAAGP